MENYKDILADPTTLRMCASCEKDNNIDTKYIQSKGWGISHGLCLRHLERMYKMANIPDEKIKSTVKRAENDTEKPPIRDLSAPENKVLINWFKNIRPPEKSS